MNWTKEQITEIEKLLKEQREICADVYDEYERESGGSSNLILEHKIENAPSPKLPDPIEEKPYCYLFEERIYDEFNLRIILEGATIHDGNKPKALYDRPKPIEIDKTFWKRLHMFVNMVGVNDPMSEEEKEYILNTALKNFKF